MLRVLLHRVALSAVAVRRKRGSPDRVAVGAGGHARFRGPVQRLLIIQRRQRLWKHLRVAHQAIAVHPPEMFGVG